MTHNFKFEIGGSFIRGEAEIKNNKTDIKITNISDPFSREYLVYFNEFLDFIDKLPNVKKIVFSLKE